jgi:hypothetical protein
MCLIPGGTATDRVQMCMGQRPAARRNGTVQPRWLFRLLPVLIVISTAVHAPAQVVRDPERTQGLVAPAPVGVHDLVILKGPGEFVSAQVTKQGRTNDLTFVILDIDGRNVVNISIAALANVGLTQSNPYGLVLLQATGDPKTLTIGFPVPLEFRTELKLSVNVQEAGVVQILANVIHGR